MRRYLVVAGLFVLSLITYIDRAAISSAKEAMAGELAMSDQAMGAVFSAFALGYAIAQIPAGWFADRAGPRLMLSAVADVISFTLTLDTLHPSRFPSSKSSVNEDVLAANDPGAAARAGG